jgi:hypothetical protein
LRQVFYSKATPKESKRFQEIPKNKEEIPRQKDLDFLGFLRPNRVFSMGYARLDPKTQLAGLVGERGVI